MIIWEIVNFVLNAGMIVVLVFLTRGSRRVARDNKEVLVLIREWVGYLKQKKEGEAELAEQEKKRVNTLARAVASMPAKIAETIKSSDLDKADSPVPVTMSATLDGTILDVCQAAASMFQYLRHDLIGKNVRMLIPDRYLAAHESGLKQIRMEVCPPWKEKTISGHGKLRDGSEVPVNVTLTWHMSPAEHVVITATIRKISNGIPAEEQK